MSLSVPCSAIVFDLDGVLVDSGDTVVAAWHRLCAEFSIDPASLGPLHGVRTVDALPSDLPADVAAAAERRLEAIEIEMSSAALPVPGALELVGLLPADRWAIATSGSQALAGARLAAAGVPSPSVLITADHVVNGKPDPAPYLAAAAGLHVAPADILVFEDAPSGAEAARAAGATVVGVATTHEPHAFEAAAWVHDLTSVSAVAAGSLVVELGDIAD